MPADRTKSLKRSESAGSEFVWAPQQEYFAGPELSFAATMTPIDYSSDTPPPLVDAPPTEFVLFPPAEETAAPRRQPHSKKKPENHIPRPPNAFILFRSSFIKSQHVSTEVETNHSTLSKIIGITWQSLPDQERAIWHQKAKEALEEHKRRFPKYAFRPVQTKAKGAASEKRKVREVEPKDIKRCAKIAQLLVEGKKGQDLENAIQQFDKTHVPEVVTRFEAPITARSYRRSSSAPVVDTENARSEKSFFQTVMDTPKRTYRASSTRPTRCSTPASVQDDSSSYSSPSSSPSPVVEAQTLSLKEEASFNFADFSFDGVTANANTYPCDPLSSIQRSHSFQESPLNNSLTIDTSFMGLDQWAPSPASMSPATPEYMMSPSQDSVVCSSPVSPFASPFDAFDQVPLEKQHFLDDFSDSFPAIYDPSFVAPSQPLGGCEAINDSAMYAAMLQQQQISNFSHGELDFTPFMTSIPQYAM
ncbi:hypothetical protein CPB83DRAFT_899630 [Crepidotus variabilis]|uniref:HMG box domain-containing protein n=1 Tax=Crepidotus variabilis TaxID=179855 RepID=A0A9P6E4T8_9AGAR|nr:hypothetical protein CPB83DRAFT_899630 [Crepidotus variabilis]